MKLLNRSVLLLALSLGLSSTSFAKKERNLTSDGKMVGFSSQSVVNLEFDEGVDLDSQQNIAFQGLLAKCKADLSDRGFSFVRYHVGEAYVGDRKIANSASTRQQFEKGEIKRYGIYFSIFCEGKK